MYYGKDKFKKLLKDNGLKVIKGLHYMLNWAKGVWIFKNFEEICMPPRNAIFFLRFREPQFDLFDIELNSQDLKEVGSNRVDEVQDDNEDYNITPPNKPNAKQLEKTVETAENQGLIKSIGKNIKTGIYYI